MPPTDTKKEPDLAKSPKMGQAKVPTIKVDHDWTPALSGPVTKPDDNKEVLEPKYFHMNGVQYWTKTFDQVLEEYGAFKKEWEESEAAAELIALLLPYKGNKKLMNVVVLGLGSFQSAILSDRTSYLQLAALGTIITTLGIQDMSVVFQDPAFTVLDMEFLESLGYHVEYNPYGFNFIHPGTLVYAIHCRPQVYDNVGKCGTPLVFIANDLKEKGLLPFLTRTELHDIEPLYSNLQSLFPMPKFGGIFSATMFYCSKDFTIPA